MPDRIALDHVSVEAFLRVLDGYRQDSCQAVVAETLAAARGRPVSNDELVDRLYGDRADGGPDWASHGLGSFVRKLREKGFPIRTVGKRGYLLERRP